MAGMLNYVASLNPRRSYLLVLILISVAVLLMLHTHIPNNNDITVTERYMWGPQRMKLRRDQVKESCRHLRDSDWLDMWPRMKDIPFLVHDPPISTRRDILFCVANNSVSNFFQRWMMFIDKGGLMTSPHRINQQYLAQHHQETLTQLGPQDVQLSFLESSSKVVFGLNPFSRIFSAYIEKLFIPNLHYWQQWGTKALEASKMPIEKCGSQVTFPQFVRYVTSSLVVSDSYLKPIASECRMCEMFYDVIGRVETLVSDLDYTSGLIRVSSHFLHEEDYIPDLREETIRNITEKAFSRLDDTKRCISLYQLGLRLWRGFQIMGFIDSSFGLPFQPDEMELISVQSFIKACKGAVWASKDTARLQLQKKQAMEEVYLSLNVTEVGNIMKAYSTDFALFGYSRGPDYLLSAKYRARLKRTDVLNHNVLWAFPEPQIPK